MGIADDLKALETLHAEGKLTDAEYASAKNAAISGSSPKHGGRPSSRLAVWIVLAVLVAAGLAYAGVSWHWSRSAPPVVAETDLTSKPTAASASAADDSARVAPAPAVMSPQDIFKMAGSAVALITVFDEEGHQRGLGSGFLVSPDGTAVTNYHVVRGASRAMAKFSDGTESDVDGVLAYNADHDVAVIRLQTPPRISLKLGNSDDTKVGDNVVAIGSPLGLQNTLSQGIVSGMRSGIIQMSAPISPGSSGGPVLDSYGKVVGVSVAYVKGGEDLNFAVPINWAKPYLNSKNPKTLAEVATENGVTDELVDGSITVPAAQSKNFTIQYDPNSMSDGEILGQVASVGGFGGKITVAIYYQNQPIFQCRETTCAIHQRITAPGNYVVMIDNRESPMFSRTVTGNISLKYVK
ncbi:MAG TPA: trypsin-like peptidase domain-containing protein [Candidatus Acidoferrales bacterium]|nr:trypsin-like peptidase domain-containing protein [Candidatus Acidoferrales bacterium]